MDNTAHVGLLAGLVIGLAAVSGFGALLIVLAAGVIGFLAGRVLGGQLDLADLVGRGRDR